MKTYLDHQFWKRINLLMQDCNDESEQEIWLNFKKYLKKETDLFLNIIPTDTKHLSLPIYNDLTAGRGKTASVKFDPEAFRFMNGPLLFQNTFEHPDILFLLEPDEKERLQKWKDKNSYLIHDHQSLITSWMIYRQLDSTKYPRSFSIRPNASFEFNIHSYNGLSIYMHPVTDIIISDRFLFEDEALLRQNLPLLLQATIERRPNINCTLFGAYSSKPFGKDPERLKQVCISL